MMQSELDALQQKENQQKHWEEQETIRIRTAVLQDAPELLALYAPYVERTVITFEYEVPTLQEFEARMLRIMEKFPYLVAEQSGVIIGYAYAGAFRERAAYQWGVETTIYVRWDCKKQGIGRKLYESLEKILALQNILNLNACIGYPETEDEYLTKDSVRFHERMGYRMVGTFRNCGYKFGRWYDMVWMEKHLGAHTEIPLPVKSFEQVKEEYKEIPFWK